MVLRHVGQRLLRSSVPRAVRPHAQHRLRRPVERARAPGSRSSSAPSRRDAWSRASTRRSPPPGPPPRDHTDRAGGRRPPAWAQVPEAVQDVGGRRRGRGARARCATSPAGSRRARRAVLEWPGRAVFVKAVGSRAQPRLADHAPPRGGDLGRAARLAALPAAARRPTTTATGWRWPSRPSTGARPGTPGSAASSSGVAAALSALHDELTPSPAPRLEPLAVYAAAALRRLGRWPSAGAPPGLDPWAAAPPRPAGRAGVGLAGGLRRARRWSTATSGPTTCCSPRDDVVFVDWPHGAVGSPVFDVVGWAPSVVLEGGPAARGAAGRATGRRATPIPTTSPCCSPRSAASSCRTRSEPRPAGAADAPPLPGRPGGGGPGLAAPPHGLVKPGAPRPAPR